MFDAGVLPPWDKTLATRRFILVMRGGLGNQLFQYAAARALSARLGAELVIDSHTGFAGDTFGRKYELGELRLAAPLLDAEEAARVKRHHWVQGHLRWRVEQVYFRCFNSLHMPHWDWRFIDIFRDIYTSEYLQSYRFFQDMGQALRQELTLSRDLPPAVTRMADSIRGCSAASVHFRSPHALSADGRVVAPALLNATLDGSYYRIAVDKLAARSPESRFFLFSDDPHAEERWAAATGSSVTTVRVATGEALLDLYLMSLCRHNIIANSTFSWWGAWLNPAADKMVYAPARWYTGPAMADFYPPDWVVI